MNRLRNEPTIDEIMGDPIVKALMAADRVDAARLRDGLRRTERRLEATSPRSAGEGGGRSMRGVPPLARTPVEARCWG